MNWDQIQPSMVEWRRELHKIPEVGLELPQTVAFVTKILTSLGIEYQLLVNGNAVIADLKGTASGKTIALRADMDGLPMKEQTGLPWASTNDNMHSCGHDGHTAMLLGAAAYLSTHRDFAGTVRLLFQPAEELPGGAKPMIAEGALEGVSAIFGIHEGHVGVEIPSGMIQINRGPMMAGPDHLLATIHGYGGHAAYPKVVIDPVVIAAEAVLGLQKIASRETDPTDPVVVSISMIHGGTAQNIIPNEVKLEGTIRTLNKETQSFVRRRVKEIITGIARTYNGYAEVEIREGYPPLVNDPEFTDLVSETVIELFGKDNLFMSNAPVMGGEDFAFYLEKVPGAFAFMSNPGSIEGQMFPHHHPKFDVDETYFEHGARLLAGVALNYLK